MNSVIKLLILVTIVSCAKNGEGISHVSNPEFNVVKLFTNEGCNIYRFFDAGSYRYYSSCRGEVFYSRSCGKNCIHHEVIPSETLTKDKE